MRVFVDVADGERRSILTTPWAAYGQVLESVVTTDGEDAVLTWCAGHGARPPVDDAQIVGEDLVVVLFDPDAVWRAAVGLGWPSVPPG